MIDPLFTSIGSLLLLVYIISILLYIYASLKPEGWNRFVGCFGVMAIGLAIELILAGTIALTWQSEVPEYVVPSSQRFATFIGLTYGLIIGYSFMWFDMIRQYIGLRKNSS